MTNKTYYEILGVSPNASTQEIREAYRTKAKTHHPDNSDHPNADRRFKQIKTAKEVLTDSERRSEYDATTHERYKQQTTDPTLVAGSTDNSDIQSWNSDQTARTATSPDTPTETQTSEPEATTRTSGHAVASALSGLTANHNAGNALVWIVSLVKQIAFGMRWVVETVWQSIEAIPYGTLAFTTSLFFLAGVAYETAIYITIPSAIIFLGIWAYMIMDWELGVGGFGFVSLILGLGYNQGFVPGGDGFKIVMTALLTALVLSFLMKINYDARGTNPPSVMDKLAGWNLDDTDPDN